jgi:hypothetical protein
MKYREFTLMMATSAGSANAVPDQSTPQIWFGKDASTAKGIDAVLSLKCTKVHGGSEPKSAKPNPPLNKRQSVVYDESGKVILT